MGLLEQLDESRRRFANRPAVSVEGGTAAGSLTYAALWARASEIAAALAGAGLARGDLVGLLLRKGPALAAHMLGTWLAGGAFVVFAPGSRWPQIRSLQRRAAMRFLFADGASLVQLDPEGGREEPCSPFVPVEISGALQQARAEALERAGLLAPLAALGGPRPAPPWAQTDPACCLMTSGSSGEPKGVLVSRDDLLQRACTEREDFGLSPEDRLLSLLPLSFDVGLNQWLSCLLSGAELVILNSWLPADVAATVERRAISGISAVPAIWYQALRAADALRPRLSGVRYVTVSGGGMDAGALAALRELLPATGIFKTYGQTEVFRSTILRPEEFTPERRESVGRAVSGCRVYLADDAGRPVATGQVGEVVHCGTGTMSGYLGDPEATAQKLRPAPALTGSDRPVVFTGDMGVLDADGYLRLHGRRDMMIKTSGYRVYPSEIENQLLGHPQVLEAAALGLPDPELGQRVVAVLVPRSSGSGFLESVLTHARSTLPPYMVPGHFSVRSALPRSATGKIRYGDLRRELERPTAPARGES